MPLPPNPTFAPFAHADAIVRTPNVRFTVLTDRLIRMEYSPENSFEDRPSQVFWFREQPVPAFRQSVTEKRVEIETNFLKLAYKPGKSGFTANNLSVELKRSGVSWHYGMKSRDAGNLKGTARTLDGDSGNTKLEDGLISTAGWAVVDDSETLVFNEKGWLEPHHQQALKVFKPFRVSPKDLYFFGYGDDIPACLRDYTRIAGPIPMIPRYILGNWWSRYWKYTQDELKALMEDFQAHDVPLSICIIDMDWHITKTGNTSDGWTGYTWNRELFPDPRGFMRWLHRQGLRTALNLHPARGVHPHEEQYEQMAKWMGIDPAARDPIPFDIADPKFMEGYFEILHHPYETALSPSPSPETGRGEPDTVDFWWMDWQQGKKSKMPGLDPLWMLNHLHYYDLGRDGRKRPFVFSRWGGLGNHRYPIGFSGDTTIRWNSLAYQPYFTATAANVGYGWWSHDIGGHMFKDKTPELYLRWVQFGVFSPIFRLHSTAVPSLDRRPWGKPERYFKAARNAMQLRHALIPYIYSMAWRAHITGMALVTPMYYGNMSNVEAFEAKDQYFFGSELVVAPVLEPSDPKTGLVTRKFWLPSGEWYAFDNGQQFAGGKNHEVQFQLEDIPVFAKSGAIVPLAHHVRAESLRPYYFGTENPAELDIYVFPGPSNRFDLYEDDGETTDYMRGKYAITRFELESEVSRLQTVQSPESLHSSFSIHSAEGDASVIPAARTYHLHLRGVGADGIASHPGTYDPLTRTFNFEPVLLSSGEKFSVQFKFE